MTSIAAWLAKRIAAPWMMKIAQGACSASARKRASLCSRARTACRRATACATWRDATSRSPSSRVPTGGALPYVFTTRAPNAESPSLKGAPSQAASGTSRGSTSPAATRRLKISGGREQRAVGADDVVDEIACLGHRSRARCPPRRRDRRSSGTRRDRWPGRPRSCGQEGSRRGPRAARHTGSRSHGSPPGARAPPGARSALRARGPRRSLRGSPRSRALRVRKGREPVSSGQTLAARSRLLRASCTPREQKYALLVT